jgi:hypothetical protein
VTERPTGTPPPTEARLPGGRVVDLVDAAAEICRRYAAQFPDEAPRYGDAWMPWCRHDNQHILSWAALDVAGFDDLDRQLDWLWQVLAARDFPVERIPRNLELAAAVMRERGEADVSDRLAEAAAKLAARPA